MGLKKLVQGIIIFIMGISLYGCSINNGFRYSLNSTDKTITIEGYFGDPMEIIIPETIDLYPVTKIKAYAFSNCKHLETIYIPKTIIDIGEEAFANTIWYHNQPNGLIYINQVLYKCKGTYQGRLNIDDGTISISPYAVTMTNITILSFPSSVRFIGHHAFIYNLDLKEVLFPLDIKLDRINDYTFEACSSLQTIYLPHSLQQIGKGAFWACENLISVGNIYLEKLKIIDDLAFNNCHNLININLPENLQTIGQGVFNNCSLLQMINVHNQNPFFKSIDGILYSKDEKKIIKYPEGKKALSYIIPEGVEIIDQEAFYKSPLMSIVIPLSIKRIETSAFYLSVDLTIIKYQPLMFLDYLGADAFTYTAWYNQMNEGPIYLNNCLYQLKGDCREIVVNETTTFISPMAFSYCRILQTIKLSNRVNYIGEKAFYECWSLKTIYLPQSITNIEKDAFNECHQLIISCEMDSKPQNWDRQWNSSNCQVNWNVLPEQND